MSPHPRADGLVQGERAALPLNVDRFHQPCLLPWRIPHGRCRNCSCSVQGQVRTAVQVPRGDHLPLAGSPVLPPLRLTGSFATPTRRYHGRMLIHPSSPCVCHPRCRGVCTHAGSGPPRVRRRLLWTCLGVPIPLAIPGFHDKGMMLVVNESKCLDIPNWEFSVKQSVTLF